MCGTADGGITSPHNNCAYHFFIIPRSLICKGLDINQGVQGVLIFSSE